jgi:hypothetical protein
VLGPVFLARDPETTRSVAVKVFRLDITPEQAAEFAAELARVAQAHLVHPAIIAPIDAGVEGTVAYLVTDYLAAESLDAAIRQYGPAPVAQAMRILTSVAGALDFAAAVGVHHGALHPRDLLVTPDDTRVTGLGVGPALEKIGLRAPMRRPYVAPERVQRESWDARADIYSLAILARDLLVGRPRPDRESGAEPRLADDEAARLQPVFAKALAARAGDRFSSALEFIGAVQHVLAAGGTAAAVAAAEPEHRPQRAEKGRQPVHDLLLPLEDETAGRAEPAAGGEVRLRLDDDQARPDLPPDVDLPAGEARMAGLADLDLDAMPAGREARADAIDLSGLDSDLTRDDPHPYSELPAAPASVEAIGEPAAWDDAENGVGSDYALGTAPDDNESPPVSRLPATEPFATGLPQAAAAPYRETPARDPLGPRLGPFAIVLIVGLVLGAIGGYLVGLSQRGTQPPLPARTDSQGPASPGPAAPGAVAPQSPAQASGRAGVAARPPAPVTPAPPSAAPATPAPVAANGVLIVRTTPRGAAVTVNGRPRGVTPLRLRDLAPGRYMIRVTRRGYASDQQEVVLSAASPSSPATVTFPLRRAGRAEAVSRTTFFGSLAVDSLPAGARVFVDGHLVGRTPMVAPRVEVGSHVVRVDRTGFHPWTASVQVVSGQRRRVTASLERESQ